MDKPHIFLGSSGKQAALLEALSRSLADVADVEPWTTVFDPGTSTLERLVELTREVDFAAFIFAQDDWTASAPAEPSGQASPRDNVVFEAGLFGGALGMRRTFILHAHGAKLPSDLLGLTCVRYDGETADVGNIGDKLRKAIAHEGQLARIEGCWWQFSLTARSAKEPSVLSLLTVARDRGGALDVKGRSWRDDGRLSARYWSEAAKETDGGVFYYWAGERPLDADVPQIYGTGEIKLDSADRATGYWISRSDADLALHARTSGVYWRADPEDLACMDGRDDAKRAALIAARLAQWKAANA